MIPMLENMLKSLPGFDDFVAQFVILNTRLKNIETKLDSVIERLDAIEHNMPYPSNHQK